MKFSPYVGGSTDIHVLHHSITAASSLEDLSSSDDSDSSECSSSPVITSIWEAYALETFAAVSDAIEEKTVQVSSLNYLLQSLSLSKRKLLELKSTETASQIFNRVSSIDIKHKREDESRSISFDRNNKAIQRSIDEIVRQETLKQDDMIRKQVARKQLQLQQAEQRRLAELKEQQLAVQVQEMKEKKERQRAERVTASQQATLREQTSDSELIAKSSGLRDIISEKEERPLIGPTASKDAQFWAERLVAFKLKVLQPISESPILKSYCSRARLKINPKLGQVTNSIEQIGLVAKSLVLVFDDAALQDPAGLTLLWCLHFYCKAVVRQAEGEVMVKPTACYPLAFLTICLMQRYDQLKELYLCRVAKKCPWVVPYVDYDKNTEAGRKSLGWKRKLDGKYEDPIAYMERQEGIFRLWAATASLNLASSPFPINHLWKFITRLLNQPILDTELRNISYGIIASFLDISGKSFINNYGSQGVKIIQAIASWVGPSRGATASRLKIILESYASLGQVGLPFEFEN